MGRDQRNTSDNEAGEAADRQRLDKWLWHARVVRTRQASASLIASGHVRLNADRVTAPGKAVRVGDVVTVALDRTVRVLRVTGFVERRGGSAVAQALYEEVLAKVGGPNG